MIRSNGKPMLTELVRTMHSTSIRSKVGSKGLHGRRVIMSNWEPRSGTISSMQAAKASAPANARITRRARRSRGDTAAFGGAGARPDEPEDTQRRPACAVGCANASGSARDEPLLRPLEGRRSTSMTSCDVGTAAATAARLRKLLPTTSANAVCATGARTTSTKKTAWRMKSPAPKRLLRLRSLSWTTLNRLAMEIGWSHRCSSYRMTTFSAPE
mmetsp:Transcript_50111/g.144370  ORF Transcript_50111/g.144370 Transcript_50111/m.144370 type:complete len:214 (-) Transcript_50111:445-1086(-)